MLLTSLGTIFKYHFIKKLKSICYFMFSYFILFFWTGEDFAFYIFGFLTFILFKYEIENYIPYFILVNLFLKPLHANLTKM